MRKSTTSGRHAGRRLLTAKLSAEPISIESVGPQLGKDNLDKGLHSGVIAFIVVSIFMVVYYFSSGLIAVFALASPAC